MVKVVRGPNGDGRKSFRIFVFKGVLMCKS